MRYSSITSAKTTALRTPRLNYILEGICKKSAVNYQPRDRRPITFPIMECLHMALSQHPGNYNYTMIMAACCMAVIHHTIPRPFDSTIQISYYQTQSRITHHCKVILKKAYNDQFWKGHTIYLGKTTHTVSLPSGCISPVSYYVRQHSRATVFFAV